MTTAQIRAAIVVRPAAGGMRRHVSLLSGGLADFGVSPTLYAPSSFVPDPVVSIPRVAIEIGASTRPLSDMATIVGLAAALRGNIDLIHAHGLRAALIAAGAAARCRIPFLFTVHNLVPREGVLGGLVLRHVARRAAAIITVSQAVSDSLVARGASAGQSEVIPNGIDLRAFESDVSSDEVRARYGVPHGATLIVSVGRLAREKGFDILSAAMEAVTEAIPEAYLVIAGDGPERQALATASAGLRIKLLGAVSNVAPLLRSADIVAIPSRSEGQGIVAIEAMAAGAPIVASRVGGLPETVPEGVAGVLTPPGNASALAAAIVALIRDPVRRTQMGEAGRVVAARYSADVMCSRVAAIYERIIDLRARR